MRAETGVRTVFAGFGVSGSLLAAVGAAFVVAGGVLAFDQWPSAELRSAAPDSFDVPAGSPPATAPSATQVRPVALPPVAPGASPTSLGDRRAARRPNRSDGGGPQIVPVGVIPPVQVTQATPPGTAGTPSVPGPETPSGPIETVTRSVTSTVRSVSKGVPATDAVVDTVAGTLERTGNAVDGLLGRRP
jgi:hypothetical protein